MAATELDVCVHSAEQMTLKLNASITVSFYSFGGKQCIKPF